MVLPIPLLFEQNKLLVLYWLDFFWHNPKLLDRFKCEYKVKTIEGSWVGARSLACSTFGIKGPARASRRGLGRVTRTYTNQTISWLVRNWNNFGAQTSHEQIQIHKTHHRPDLREATTFPLIIFFMPSHRANTQMSFCPTTLKLESRNFWNWNFRNFGGPLLCVKAFNWIEVWSKVVTFIESFSMICGTTPTRKEIKLIPDF